MGLCSYSSNLRNSSSTIIDNEFINEFLPSAPDGAVKVYLYGLYLCNAPQSDDNDISSMSTVLSLSVDQIFEYFTYWQELGLVQIMNKTPLEVKYLSAKKFSGNSKIRTKAKYKDFNDQVQEILNGRMITPLEFNEYYNLIELHHFEPDAVIMIIKYCTKIKSTSINYPYILAVAKSFENEGIKSVTALEQKFLEQEQASGDVKDVLKALGLNRDADLDERNMYLKWTNNFGFTKNVVLLVASSLNKKGGMSKLDETLSKYYEQKLFTLEDIENYSKQKEEFYDIAKKVTSTLGLYYQNLDSTVEVYIKDWVQKGFDKNTLALLAIYCYKQDIRSLSLMNEAVIKFFKKGLISSEAITQYLGEVVAKDESIKKILEALGSLRKVNSADRDIYNTWSEDWNINDDIIMMVAEKSKGTANPIRYMNKLLSEIHAKNISTLEEATKLCSQTNFAKTETKIEQNMETREYSKEVLDALFDSLDDIEV